MEKTIRIRDGKEVRELPCRVTMGAMVRFKREAGRDVSELGEKDIADLVLFIWCCVVSACNADGVSFDMAFERFADSLDPDGVSGFYKSMDEDSSVEKKTLTDREATSTN